MGTVIYELKKHSRLWHSRQLRRPTCGIDPRGIACSICFQGRMSWAPESDSHPQQLPWSFDPSVAVAPPDERQPTTSCMPYRSSSFNHPGPLEHDWTATRYWVTYTWSMPVKKIRDAVRRNTDRDTRRRVGGDALQVAG